MRNLGIRSVGCFFLLCACILAANALATPQLMNAQGRLSNVSGDTLQSGTYSITFSIYDSEVGGIVIWTETNPSVQIFSGQFNVLLGSINPIHDSVFSGDNRWLGVKIGNEPEMEPRSRLVTVAYAQRIATIDGARGGSVENRIDIQGSASDEFATLYMKNYSQSGQFFWQVSPDGNCYLYDANRGEYKIRLGTDGILRVPGKFDVMGLLSTAGDVAINGRLWVGSWEDHSIELADLRKRIRSTADPDGALILYTSSYQNSPRWEFRDLKDEELKASISGSSGNAWFAGTTSSQVVEIRGGSDLAEPFEMSCGNELAPGSVVVIDESNPGKLCLSSRAYDSKVAGIISGGGGIKPGLTLKQEGLLETGQNVALSGRVYVLATASNGAIMPGDRLTTSDIPGYAMKATDLNRTDGAVIGKAMSELKSKRGLVLVLVNLQ